MNDPSQFISYAQHGEDVILWRALGDRKAGVYVDIGAFDPTDDSVTRALYERGWRGINIEPQPERIEAFERERPEDTNLSMAMGDYDGRAVLTLAAHPGWASIMDPELTGNDPATAATLDVPIRGLDTLLPELGVEHVDILKIDVEGAEPAVVRGLLKGKVRPLVCVVEGVAPGVGRTAGDEAVALLVDAGYIHCLFDGLNHYLTTDRALQPALSAPANPLDGHTRISIVNLQEERHQLHATIAALTRENASLMAIAAPPVVERASSSPTPKQTTDAGFPVADGDSPTGPYAGELPVAPLDLGSAREPSPMTPAPKPASAVLDHAMRARRRRTAFTRLLQGEAAGLPPAPAVPQLLTLAVTDLPPGEAISFLYEAVLGREVDTGSLNAWSHRLESGEPLLDVARDLATCAEAADCPLEHRARIHSELLAWESLVTVTELGIGSYLSRTPTPHTPGSAAHEIFVEALFEVALQRRPSPDETRLEVAKLAGGAGRDWLLRAYAARPEATARLLGKPGVGLRGRLRYWRGRRRYIETFCALVLVAEARQVDQILNPLSPLGSAVASFAPGAVDASGVH